MFSRIAQAPLYYLRLELYILDINKQPSNGIHSNTTYTHHFRGLTGINKQIYPWNDIQ
jgi:hypothetical protein